MENKIFDFLQPQSTLSLLSKNSVDNNEKQPESLPKILKFIFIKFLQIYGLRICFSLVKALLSLKSKGLKGITFELILDAVFNIPNLRTAGFVSLLSGLFRLLNYIFKLFGKENMTSCFIWFNFFIFFNIFRREYWVNEFYNIKYDGENSLCFDFGISRQI